MPRSRSWSLESMARSAMCWFSRTEPDCLSSWSTSVVLPWSTWAMMAMLRISMNRALGAQEGAGLIDAGNAAPQCTLVMSAKFQNNMSNFNMLMNSAT